MQPGQVQTDDNADVAAIKRLATQSKDRPVWVRVGQLIDGVSDRPMRDASILFDAKQIYAVATDGARPVSEHLATGQDAPDAELSAFTALPCLIEAHAHLFLEGSPVDFQQRTLYLKQDARGLLVRAQARWPKLLQFGVGTVRDAGDKDGVGLALASAARAQLGQLATVPWIDSPGAAIHHRGRYGSFMGAPIEDHGSPAECVAARVEQGAQRIKLLVSGIINFKVGRVTAPPQLTIDEVTALVKAAADHGRQTFAHASGTAGIENSIEGRVTTVEHGFFCTQDQLARMRDRNIAWVPTFAPVQAQIDYADRVGWGPEVVGHLSRIIDGHRQMLSLAHTMGVQVIAGSDAGSCGVPHGAGLLTELCHMEHGGMPSMAVLKSATGDSARALDFAEPVGRIAAGCRSRLIFTRHDPLITVANLLRGRTVVFDGKVVRGDQDVSTAGL